MIEIKIGVLSVVMAIIEWQGIYGNFLREGYGLQEWNPLICSFRMSLFYLKCVIKNNIIKIIIKCMSKIPLKIQVFYNILFFFAFLCDMMMLKSLLSIIYHNSLHLYACFRSSIWNVVN